MTTAITAEAPAAAANLVLRPINDTSWDGEWDALAGQEATAGFMQSSFWAEVQAGRRLHYRCATACSKTNGLIGGRHVFGLSDHASTNPECCFAPKGRCFRGTKRGNRTTRASFTPSGSRKRRPERAWAFVLSRTLPRRARPFLRNWQRAPLDLAPLHTLMLDVSRKATQPCY